MSGVVDWKLAQRIAGQIGGQDDASGLREGRARELCDEALERVIDYTGLELLEDPPSVELLDRRAWSVNAIETMAELGEPLERKAAESIRLPWPLGSAFRGALGAAAGAEAGVLAGYASRRVLGQYDVSLANRDRPSRLILVAPNVIATASELKAEVEPFLLWIAIHEQTHTAQFTAVPWLRDYMADLLAELIDASGDGIDFSDLVSRAKRILTSDPRTSLRNALRGELMRALAGPRQRELLDRLQATMCVVEGYAEHVMDAAVAGESELEDLRGRLEKRRAARGGLGEAIARFLGLGAKMRQYELGKSFCDEVHKEGGLARLNEVWSSPDALPTLAELENPASWRSPAHA